MKKNGFTIIELIIVIALIAIFTAGALTILNPLEQLKKGNDARRKSDLSQIQKAMEAFYNDTGRYPTATINYKIQDLNGNEINWGSSWPPYMNLLPADPGKTNYIYYSGNGQSYYLYASLERGVNDPDACQGGQCPSKGGLNMGSACGKKCNYGVSSSNVSIE